MCKVKMNVQGCVQGIGFRYTTKMVADQLGVTRTVKSEDDGSVAIEAIGNGDTTQEFIKEVEKFPNPSRRVQYVDVQEDPMIEERKKFDVVG